jgi:hypothetical protein
VGALDRVKFWRKEETPQQEPAPYDLGSPQRFGDPTNPMMTDPSGFPQTPTPQQFGGQQFGQQQFDFGQEQQPEQTGPQGYAQYPASQPFPGTGPQAVPEERETVHPRDIELVLAKLDAIKSELDALHQRVRRIEERSDASSQSTQAQRRYW